MVKELTAQKHEANRLLIFHTKPCKFSGFINREVLPNNSHSPSPPCPKMLMTMMMKMDGRLAECVDLPTSPRAPCLPLVPCQTLMGCTQPIADNGTVEIPTPTPTLHTPPPTSHPGLPRLELPAALPRRLPHRGRAGRLRPRAERTTSKSSSGTGATQAGTAGSSSGWRRMSRTRTWLRCAWTAASSPCSTTSRYARTHEEATCRAGTNLRQCVSWLTHAGPFCLWWQVASADFVPRQGSGAGAFWIELLPMSGAIFVESNC